MAIAGETVTIQGQLEWRTWRVEIYIEKGQQIMLRVYRELVLVFPDGSFEIREKHQTPLTIPAENLPSLAPYLNLSPGIATLFQSIPAEVLLGALPVVVADACDALDRKTIAEQATSSNEPTP